MAKPERGATNPPHMTTREYAAMHGNPTRSALKADASARIGKKIAKLRREGKSAKEAAGAAYGMEREGRLGPKGGYKRKGS